MIRRAQCPAFLHGDVVNRHSVTIFAVLVMLGICGAQYYLWFSGRSGIMLLSGLLSLGWFLAFIVARVSAGFWAYALLLTAPLGVPLLFWLIIIVARMSANQ